MPPLPEAAAAAALRVLRRQRPLHGLRQLAAGAGVLAVPVAVWWHWSRGERSERLEEFRTRVQLPRGLEITDTYDYLITEQIQAGDVLLFDRRCELCAAGPWAALACLVGKQCLTGRSTATDAYLRAGDKSGRIDHVGLVVPGYVVHRGDEYDPTNLLLLEATPSGVMARPLKDRLELSASQSVLLVQLACPGEERDRGSGGGDGSNGTHKNTAAAVESPSQIAATRARAKVERNLTVYRDQLIQAGGQRHYQYLHSTVMIGGAVGYALGLQDHLGGPVSPAAYLALSGLQAATAAMSVADQENFGVKPADFLRDDRFAERDSVRLRPGWRFMAPKPLKQAQGRY